MATIRISQGFDMRSIDFDLQGAGRSVEFNALYNVLVISSTLGTYAPEQIQIRGTDLSFDGGGNLIGGTVTAIVLEIMKSAFAFYLTRFPTYTIIYGAFATLPIFLLWIYLSWLAVLLGATLASSAPLIRLGRWHINRYPGASFVDALDALRALRQAQLSTPGGSSRAPPVLHRPCRRRSITSYVRRVRWPR